MSTGTRQDSRRERKFGTFGGVFTPCTLTILGVIMFLRFGDVVGQAGVLAAVLIVLSAKLITTLTSLSLSAIVTSTQVQGGGAYYLISRTLGVEFGGAIGILFFLAQAVSVAMYVIGFTEALTGTVPALRDHGTETAALVNLLVFLCVYTGAGWTIRLQYVILAVLMASLASFYFGAVADFSPQILKQNLRPAFDAGESVWTVFALFFRAVTGIMAGANMSGDLANPARSIPRGTLAAIAFTGLIYVSLAVLLGGCRSSGELTSGSLVLRDIAAWPGLITAGVFAATLSSALGSMMGAPRILQALARDEIFPSLRFFGAGGDGSGEPRRAAVLTFMIAQLGILAGDLNTIAPVITMFFMITYGLLNLATFYEAVTGNPSYRPAFRYCHWSVSLAGAVFCVVVMFLISWFWATVSLLVIAGVHRSIRVREIRARWGDINSGIALERLRRSLLRLEQQSWHPRNWRPFILALSRSEWTRPQLAVYGHWLTAGHGILTLAHVVTGDPAEHAERQSAYEKTLRQYIRRRNLQAFPAVVVSENVDAGLTSLIQCHGIGGLRPNTVMLNWPRGGGDEDIAAFGRDLRLLSRFGRSIVCLRRTDAGSKSEQTDTWSVPDGSIDVWWRGQVNGQLMLLLAHLLRRNPGWRHHPLRLMRVVPNQEALAEVRQHLTALASSSRIDAEPVAVCGEDVARTIQTASVSAAVVIIGFQPPEEGTELDFYSSVERLTGRLPDVLIVHSSGEIKLEP